MFKIGDYVQTKTAVKLEDDFDVIFQWSGEVAEINEDSINVVFDAVSLEQLSWDYVKSCEDFGYDWESYNFIEEELEGCEQKGTEVARKNAIKKIIDHSNAQLEKEEAALKEQMKKWGEAFEASSFCEEMTDYQKENASFIIHTFTDFMQDYLWLGSPDEWTIDDIEEVCLEIAPRKITTEIELFENYGDVLIQFFKFLEDAGHLRDTKPFQKHLQKIKGKIAPASQNPNDWGPAKALMMQAMQSGVDMEDEKAIDAFLRKEQARGFSNINPLGGMRDTYQPREPIRKSLMEKIGRNQKISVQYTDGKVVEEIKFKKVEKDISEGKCKIIKF